MREKISWDYNWFPDYRDLSPRKKQPLWKTDSVALCLNIQRKNIMDFWWSYTRHSSMFLNSEIKRAKIMSKSKWRLSWHSNSRRLLYYTLTYHLNALTLEENGSVLEENLSKVKQILPLSRNRSKEKQQYSLIHTGMFITWLLKSSWLKYKPVLGKSCGSVLLAHRSSPVQSLVSPVKRLR